MRLAEELIPVERWALACPALPTCGLALTEAERVRATSSATIAAVLARSGLEQERLSIRITGCPNGCARPYTGDIGIVGRVPGFYSLYVGGDFEGTRLNAPFVDKVTLDAIGAALDPLFARYAARRQPVEGFGDFCHRIGMPALQQVLAHDDEAPAACRRLTSISPESGSCSSARAPGVPRLALLDEAGATALEVYAPAPDPELAEAGGPRLRRRRPSSDEIAGTQLVFVAEAGDATAGEIRRVARAAGVLINVEDDRDQSHFHSAAVIRRGDLTIGDLDRRKEPEAWRRLYARCWIAKSATNGNGGSPKSGPCGKAWRAAGAAPGAIGRLTRDWALEPRLVRRPSPRGFTGAAAPGRLSLSPPRAEARP